MWNQIIVEGRLTFCSQPAMIPTSRSMRTRFWKSILLVPLQLGTAGGDLTLHTIGDFLCGGIVCHGCVFNPLLTVSRFSTARGEKYGIFNEGRPEGYGVLKVPSGNVKHERSGGLDHLVGGGDERSAFSHVALTWLS